MRDGWQFRIDPSAASTPSLIPDGGEWQSVSVPHTWQALGGLPEYVGVAWYRRDLLARESRRTGFVRLEFEAVYHTAHVFLNGKMIGQHIGKGYTAFTCDLSPHLGHDKSNELLVRVDNSFSNAMLPRMKSFDWANDGGLIRPVQLLITPPVFIERLVIEAVPDLENNHADVSVCAVVRNSTGEQQDAHISVRARPDGDVALDYPHAATHLTIPPSSSARIAVGKIQIDSPNLWHFDSPNLYCAVATLETGGGTHTLGDTFGIRKFEIRGTSFYLNGERVSLIGVERMAGSNPQYGMAEPSHWIDANLRDMKDLNCVFTRVHWPQDKRVLEACDRYGILMQEEVPAWGAFTFDNISPELERELIQNGREQISEMVDRDRNHPCIVSWGLCNEVNGKNPITRRFAHAVAEEARKTDPSRLMTYASNSLHENPGEDMAGDFDFISINEYFGTWSKGGVNEARAYLDDIRKAFPGKPLVISEYGYCECRPDFAPGDQHRVDIIERHTRLYRDIPEIAGAIYFDYNDYRTQMGDKGVGAFQQRVHGVVNLEAERKPSFKALREQSSPIKNIVVTSTGNSFTARIVTRADLPFYILRGYSIRWILYGYDDLPTEGTLQMVGPISPGQDIVVHWTPSTQKFHKIGVEVLRPTGFSAATASKSLRVDNQKSQLHGNDKAHREKQ
ncbi:MAG: glycoside hydrolase family 2 TIM barrel-domain containing protein [Acidobacteriaceae bacterium]